MCEQMSFERCGVYRPKRGLEFEVRSVRRNSGFKAYGWEIVDYITGEVVRQSVELFRKPHRAWTAGTLALAEKAPNSQPRVAARQGADTSTSVRVP